MQFFGTASSLPFVLWLQRILPTSPTSSLALFLTIISSCSIASPSWWASSSRDTLSLPRHWFLGLQHLVLVLHVVGGVGEGGEGHGEGWKVGQGRRQQRGGDAEGPRQHRRRGEPQPLQLRLLETFRFCSPVLEPDFHLKMSPFQSMYHRFPRRMKKLKSSPVSL